MPEIILNVSKNDLDTVNRMIIKQQQAEKESLKGMRVYPNQESRDLSTLRLLWYGMVGGLVEDGILYTYD